MPWAMSKVFLSDTALCRACFALKAMLKSLGIA